MAQEKPHDDVIQHRDKIVVLFTSAIKCIRTRPSSIIPVYLVYEKR